MYKRKFKIEETQWRAIQDAKTGGYTILMMVDGFQSDKEAKLLRDFLWVARIEGVPVQFVPADADFEYEYNII